MPRINRYYTAVWNGEEHTKTITQFAHLTGRSRTFLKSRIDEADDFGHENPMQYALEAKVGETRYRGGSKAAPKSTHAEVLAEERRYRQNKHIFDAFIFGGSHG